ncbi:immunoglobulin lambda-1 light chain-like isoform X2 [Anabas testudineus]|uniref:immunoglobulin lambda-1 light chain-like isoform X2 n=1 Tax=Anabas testudineus TaxID=64144 RepID=UPI000E455BD2|nr:immunoglobulin lambda-1 light chain-like isoform X2 [Anabas testudineus]
MLFLPAAALCCLCSALVIMAAELVQDDLTLTRRVGQTVSFSCGRTDQCYNQYVYWYQKKETETFRVILDIDKRNGNIDKGYSSHPQKDDFTSVNKGKGWQLELKKVQLDHSASYYCSCSHRYRYRIFGSGTKLYVTGEQVLKPVVSVYPAASRDHLEGKSSLLCVASDMFPPLVQFSWKRRKENRRLEELLSVEGEQLELRESGRSASILLLHQPQNSTYKYRCEVKHEGGTVEAQTQQEISTFPPENPRDVFVPSQYQVKLLCLLYTVLIVKSLVYCCGLSLLRILTDNGASSNYSHDD